MLPVGAGGFAAIAKANKSSVAAITDKMANSLLDIFLRGMFTSVVVRLMIKRAFIISPFPMYIGQEV